MTRARAAVAVLLLAAALTGGSAGAQADGPALALDRTSVRAGESVVVTLTGWKTRVVTVSMCGNLAARASADCNQVASEGIGRNRDGSPTSRDFVVLAPPVPCPCVLRAASVTSDEVAVAPLDLVGHPVGEVVGPAGVEPVEVTVDVRRAPAGFADHLRAALGGPTGYEVTVSVENRSAHRLEHVVLAGAVGRAGGGDVADLDLPAPGPLDPGQRWEGTARTAVPAPALGTYRWEVTASGAGAAVTGLARARTLPLLLFVVVVLLLADVAAIAWRWRGRRLAAGDVRPPDRSAPPGVHGGLTTSP